MDATELLDLPHIVVTATDEIDNEYQIECQSDDNSFKYPVCHHKSNIVRAYYTRIIQDLPIAEHTTWLILRVRKFDCSNAECKHHTFTEPLRFAKANAKRTNRLDNFILRTVAE